MVKTRRRKTVKNRTMKKQIKNRQLRKRRTKKRGGTADFRRNFRSLEKNAADDMHEIIFNIDDKIKNLSDNYNPSDDDYSIKKIEDIPKKNYEKIKIDSALTFFIKKMDENSAIFVLFTFLLFVYYTNDNYPSYFETININDSDNDDVKFKKKILKYLSHIIKDKDCLPNLKELASKFNVNNFKKMLAEKIYERTQKYLSVDQKKDTDFSSLRMFLETEINYLDRLFKIKERGEYVFPGIKIKEKDKYSFNIGESSPFSEYVPFSTSGEQDRKNKQMIVYHCFTNELFNTLMITAA